MKVLNTTHYRSGHQEKINLIKPDKATSEEAIYPSIFEAIYLITFLLETRRNKTRFILLS